MFTIEYFVDCPFVSAFWIRSGVVKNLFIVNLYKFIHDHILLLSEIDHVRWRCTDVASAYMHLKHSDARESVLLAKKRK